MKPVSIRTVAMVVSTFLTSFSVCSAEARAKQLLTSFVSCQVSNTALDEAGISEKMLKDANSNMIVTMKVFSMLPDANSVGIFAKPVILTMDGLPGPIKTNTHKIDSTASIKENTLIELKIDWQKTDSNAPGIESVKTKTLLHSGQPAVLGCQRLNDHTLFLIVTSEILDPNKSKANSVSAEQNIALQSAKKLNKLSISLAVYANEHNERFPDNFEQLKNVDVNDTDMEWLQENVEYLGAGKPVTSPANEVIAYDKTLLKKFEETNILSYDMRVESVTAERLKHELQGPAK